MPARKPPALSKRPLSAVLLAVAAMLGACGGGSEDVTAPSAPSAEATQAIDTQPTPNANGVEGSLTEAPSAPLDSAAAPRHAAEAAKPAAAMQPLALAGGRKLPQPTVSIAAEAVASTSSAHVLYVSTAGNDAWSGLLAAPNGSGTDGPKRTLAGAQAAVRSQLAAMKSGAAAHQPVRVLIAAGEYRIASTLQFGPLDSGAFDMPVSYEAITPGSVTVSGGVPLTPKIATAVGVPVSFTGFTQDLLGVRGGGQLYVNGKRATLARHPNENSSWFVQKAVPLSSEPAGKTGREAFAPTSEALTWVNGLSSDEKARAIVNVMQSWSGGHHRLSTLGTPAGSLRIQPAAMRAFLEFGPSQRFFVENVTPAFDAPGEWLPTLQGANYLPTSAELGKALNPVFPVLDRLIWIRGDLANRAYVQYLSFKGLSFAYTRRLITSQGYADMQAGVEVGAAIEVDGAKNVQFDACHISKVAGYGVWLRQSVANSSVTNTTMTDMGGGGVKIGMPNQSPTDALQTGSNVVSGNRISETGKVYTGSVGVWVGQSFGNTVSNNAIFNTTYTGISIGWTWGYGATTSGNNVIADNLLVNIGQGNLSDMGGIYTVGISPGTRITGNVIREVRGYPQYGAGAWGIYNDEGASGVLVDNNVVIGTDSGGYHLNYGRSNQVSRNLFAKGMKYEVRVTTTDPNYTRLTTDANLMLPVVKQPFDRYASAPDVIYTNNKVSSTLSPAGIDASRCGSGCSVSGFTMSTSSDPREVTLSGVDSTIATRIATTAAQAGPLDLGATPIVEVPSAPPVVVVAPPTALDIDIANGAIGTQPKGLSYVPGNNASAIGIVGRSDAPNGRCLAFNDSGSYRYVYEPYAYTTLNHNTGTSTGEVSMILDAASNLIYEWRDSSNPYRTGPALQITAQGIAVKGRIVAAAPIGRWFTVKVSSRVDNPTGTWTLTVIGPNGTTTVNNLNFGTTGWSKLNWMGIISNTQVPSTACFSTIKVSNTAN